TAFNDDGADGGGGIDNEISAANDSGEVPFGMTLANDIVAGNINNGSPDCYNCVTSPTDFITVDAATLASGNPQLGALQVNGLNTTLATMLPLPGSPVIAAGDTAELPAELTTDERGYPRLTGGKLDLGAAQTDYTAIQFYQQPTDTLFDTDISPAPSVEVLESNGTSTDSVSGIPITLTYSDSPNITGTLTETTTPTVVGSNTIALATFGDLEPTAVASGVTLTATAGALTIESSPFDVTGNVTNTSASNASATYSLSNQSVTLYASVTSGSGNVNAGSVTFTIFNGSSVQTGTPVTGTVSGGSASANYTLPGDTTGGTYTIQAVYSGGASFAASSDNTHTLTVNPAPQSINYFATLTSPVVYSAAPITLSATATSGLTVTFRVVSGPATVSGTQLTLTGAGIVKVGADQSGDLDYQAATEVTQSITVDPAGYVVTVNTDDPTAVNALNCPVGGPTPPTTGMNCSLRDALAAAAAYSGGNITFYAAAFNTSNTTAENTITMTGATMSIPSNTFITGPTAGATQVNLVTVDGANTYTVFSVDPSVTSASISNLTIQHGYTTSAGGAIQNQGVLTLNADTFYANQSTGSAGAIANASQGQLFVIDSTFFGNSAAVDGGAIAAEGTLVVSDSTFDGNTAGTSTGGIAMGSPGSMTLANSIVIGNTVSGSGDDIDTATSFDYLDEGGNIVGYLNGSLVDTTPILLAPLGHYGGPTQTMIPLPGSPAICAGQLENIPSGLTTDQRGYPNTNSNYTSTCDDSGAVQTNYSIGFMRQPSNVGQNVIMAPAPTVQLYESGVVFFDGTDAFTIGLTLSTGPGTLSGDSAATAAATGLASYSGLSVNQTGTGDMLTASLTLTPASITPAIAVTALSGPFNVIPSVTQLAFLTPPATPVTVGGNAGSPVQVEEENSSSQVVTTATDTITLVVTGPSGSSYSATYTATATSGVASFTTLSGVALTFIGGYTYTASITTDSSVTPAVAHETVNKANSILGGPSTASFIYGAGGTIPVTVTGQGEGAGIATPSGNVTYTIGTGAAQTAVISAGGATLVVPAGLASGPYTVTVNYGGDGNYNAATSITIDLTIGTATLMLKANSVSRVYGAPNPTFTGSVTG
ncbi:MAG: choice-of-anchor Q domain-containing protein, partial [Terracidiphilus sp.]